MTEGTPDWLQDMEPKPLGDCPDCAQPIEQVGAEVWHARPFFPDVHPRDCLPSFPTGIISND